MAFKVSMNNMYQRILLLVTFSITIEGKFYTNYVHFSDTTKNFSCKITVTNML